MEEKITRLIDLVQKTGVPIEEYVRKVFAKRDEFIEYVNKSNHSKEWLMSKLDKYSVWQFMDIVNEAREQGKTFEEVEAQKFKSTKQLLESALKGIGLVKEFE